MKKKIILSYNWSRNDGKKKISTRHEEALEEDAMSRIFEMTKEGYTSGELHTFVRMDGKDGEDGISYSGWWDMTTVTE